MKKLILPILAILLFATSALAAPQTVTETHTYVLGDNDSKNDARAMCFLEAKRKMLEKAGTLVMSHTQAESGVLTKDEINSYTAALIKVEASGEKWRFNESGSMVVVMTVQAVLDYDDIKKRLNDIQKDSKTKQKILEQQKRLVALEKMILELQQRSSPYSLKNSRNQKNPRLPITKQAIYELAESAKIGNAEAQQTLGRKYYYGEGALKNYREARYWYTRAAEQGDEESMYALFRINYFGEGQEQDIVNAYKWLSLAEKYGHKNTVDSTKKLEKEMSPGEIMRAIHLAGYWSNEHPQK